MAEPEGDEQIEIITKSIRIAFSRIGDPSFRLEFLLNGRWTPGVEYDTMDDARRAGLRLSERSIGKSNLSIFL